MDKQEQRDPVLRLASASPRRRQLLELIGVPHVVTPADILSGIAGNLPEGRREEVAEATRRDDGSWLVDGRMDIHRVERLLAVEGMTRDEEYTTLAGFVLWQLRRVPRVGESFVWRDLRFEVVDLDGRRIDKVLIEAAAAATGEPPRQAARG